MKNLLLTGAILAAGVVYASTQKDVKNYGDGAIAWNNIYDTVPQDTTDTTDKPDSIFLADFIAKK